MRRMLFVPLAAVISTWCSPGFAQQVVNGASPTALSPTGVTSGVAMTGQGGGGTLTVGVVGGAEMDIFTNNSSSGAAVNPLLKAVSTDTSSQSNIVFNSSSNVYGAIGVTQPGGPFFLNISGGNNGTAVNFFGGEYATITTVGGTGSLNFQNGSTNITATNFAADGVISLAPNTTIIGAVTTNTANTGTLSLGGGGVVTGAVGGATGLKAINVVGGSNAAGVSASISGAVDSYAFNLGTNTLNIGGALTIASKTASGVINTTLASPTVYGNIKSVGASNLGPTLGINVTVPSTAFIPVGTQFNIVQATSGTNGSILKITVQDPTNPLYTFSAVPLAGTVAGQVTIQTMTIPLQVPLAPPIGAVVPPTLPIAAVVVPVIVALAPITSTTTTTTTTGTTPTVPSDLVSNILPAINALTTPGAVITAVAQLAPSRAALAAPAVTFEGTRSFQDLWLSRLDDVCDQTGEPDKIQAADPDKVTSATCPGRTDERSGWWLKGFGYFGNQGTQGAFTGYDSKILGVMIAYDTMVDSNTRAGLGLGYAKSTVDARTHANTDFNSYNAMAYVDHAEGQWFVDGDLALGWNNYSGARKIDFTGINRVASAKYDGQDFTAYGTTGYHLFAEGLTITPLASLQYTRMSINNYTETGAGNIDLNVKAQSYDFLEGGLGVVVAKPMVASEGTYVPEIHFKWLDDFNSPNIANTASFAVAGSKSFVTPGLKTSATTFDGGAGLKLLSCGCEADNWSVEAVYDYYWKTGGYHAQEATIRISDRF